ncbi:hypothetical protein [Streptomyces sulphureus]|uniref:hypothetical protein n=1 Tax=Streptomyces sulphureus TaxID=47758 RepID=UPI00037008F1|nr:hypothetical protein [Streptomyces sulphureus]
MQTIGSKQTPHTGPEPGPAATNTSAHHVRSAARSDARGATRQGRRDRASTTAPPEPDVARTGELLAQTHQFEPTPEREPAVPTDSTAGGATWAPFLAGAAFGIGGIGAALVLADVPSPLRAPFALFFLLAAPAAGLAALLIRLDPLSRAVVAVVGAAALDLLVAQTMLAAEVWSARGGTAAVAVLSMLLLAAAALRPARGRNPGRGA